MDELIAFLVARLGEAETRAWAVHDVEKCDALLYEEDMAATARRDPDCDCGYPARVLREVAAKRAIIEVYEAAAASDDPKVDYSIGMATMRMVLRSYATVHSDHPDYRSEWKP